MCYAWLLYCCICAGDYSLCSGKKPVFEWQCPQSSSYSFQWPPNQISPAAAPTLARSQSSAFTWSVTSLCDTFSVLTLSGCSHCISGSFLELRGQSGKTNKRKEKSLLLMTVLCSCSFFAGSPGFVSSCFMFVSICKQLVFFSTIVTSI